MNIITKQIHYQHFLSKWEKQFKKVKFILEYLSSYNNVIDGLQKFLPFVEDIETSQLEWIGLVNQLENPIDKSFFKPYWIPLQANEYDLFLDISSSSFKIFTVDYFWLEPYQWYKVPLCSDVSSLLLLISQYDYDISSLILQHKERKMAIIDRLSTKRKEFESNNNQNGKY